MEKSFLHTVCIHVRVNSDSVKSWLLIRASSSGLVNNLIGQSFSWHLKNEYVFTALLNKQFIATRYTVSSAKILLFVTCSAHNVVVRSKHLQYCFSNSNNSFGLQGS